ncbi:hypothetical protein PSN45_005115 [Yamadazyma tenuis]|uniref:Uncharacterized protein n=1 Tax=Candida tenuis (strain ATCC 10573 / BCRC 21748 / CBS 615 / JCM 9827 / NBRC 10315 / NRRL Y-1498 / VKM Y-70) TaxID=590646 RepID=G3B2V0_CANTC|nr:uncharacterized protein CANTEDRAFT_113546 [Yamadazyma tenuis ATCC 10573]XP_006685934.1 uncharacterized protein CANTEDRAFT_113546 [Yamadazyma tenuis ATCC 10573]EGV65127.1 hypothetical protein CANTEDRAFT_113546 [Yamadazyma tenuis ATCC 10573]EGV65128.1 hypothetical protein CANTEDRAFT_113546 [Yamadazyma tenuis ATCC 10573]WEJ97559.1 hypothetical protein PSN45_005115 [Yamadazyma tenuis]
MTDEIPEPAPYGGLLVQSIEDENDRAKRLAEQTVDVSVNGTSETLRPEAIHIRGVNSLSTKNIEAFINYYVNYVVTTENNEESGLPTTTYTPVSGDAQRKFRVQWINDGAVNIVFTTHEDATHALDQISITGANPAVVPMPVIYQVNLLVQERETKPYTPVIEFQKRTTLAHRLGVETETSEAQTSNMDEDESAVVLYARLSFQSDRKVKNAAVYSRYYLLHGEPERRPHKKRPINPKKRRHQRDYSDDLFADKLQARARPRGREEVEDLFADAMARIDRSRSPTRDRSRSPMRDE